MCIGHVLLCHIIFLSFIFFYIIPVYHVYIFIIKYLYFIIFRVVDYMIDSGAHCRAVDGLGHSAMHYAALKGSTGALNVVSE